MRPLHAALPLLAAVLVTSACGGQQSSTSRIREDTAAVVKAMNAKDYPAARRALAVLDSDLAAAGRLDQLQAGTVSELRAGVASLKADLALVSPTPSPTPSVRRTTPPPVRAGDGKKRHGKHDD